jgi:hypothetical protein
VPDEILLSDVSIAEVLGIDIVGETERAILSSTKLDWDLKETLTGYLEPC